MESKLSKDRANGTLDKILSDQKVGALDLISSRPASKMTELIASWHKIVANYNKPSLSKSWLQILNSVVPYFVIWLLIGLFGHISPLITIGLGILAAGFMARSFIIFHDCAHGSFFKTAKANKILGSFLSIITFTPFYKWRHEHITHHSTVGNLDDRGVGDIDTLTVEEYLKLSKFKRFLYRVYRHPILLFFIAPFFLFLFINRFSFGKLTKKDTFRLIKSNIWIIAFSAILLYTVGWQTYLIGQITILYISSSVGVWLFYVQHQYEDVIWKRKEDWDQANISIYGSSFFKLPRLLQWFSGNIGFHHIHHLSPKIPNYNLESCHYENEAFEEIKPITFWGSFKTWKLKLWDEERQKLVGFKSVRLYYQSSL